LTLQAGLQRLQLRDNVGGPFPLGRVRELEEATDAFQQRRGFDQEVPHDSAPGSALECSQAFDGGIGGGGHHDGDHWVLGWHVCYSPALFVIFGCSLRRK